MVNICGENAVYRCHFCDLELLADDVNIVVAGSNCANGEFAPCPECGFENLIDRDDLEYM